MLLDEIEATTDRRLRVDKLLRMAVIYEQRLDDAGSACVALQAALHEDPGRSDTRAKLERTATAAGAWKQVLAGLTDSAVDLERSDLDAARKMWLHVGGWQRDRDARRAAYRRALALFQDDTQALTVLAGLHESPEQWELAALAAAALTDIYLREQRWDEIEPLIAPLIRSSGERDGEQLATLHNRLGHARVRLGTRHGALASFGSALTCMAGHRDSLRQVLDLSTDVGDWYGVATSLRALADGASDDDHLDLLDELAGVWSQRLGRPEMALEVCREVLAQRPSDRRALRKTLDLQMELQLWEDSLDVLDQLTQLELNPLRRGKYLEMGGAICCEQLDAPRHSVDYFESALDCYFVEGSGVADPDSVVSLKPFEQIDAIHTHAGDTEAREASYLRMIDRFPPDDPNLPRVLDTLGDVYRTCLDEPAKAVGAYEAAAELEPACRERQLLLAELNLSVGPESADKAIEQRRVILADDPRNTTSLQALRELYIDTSRYDRAWCVCAVLSYLDRATAEERRYYSTYKSPGIVKSTTPLAEHTLDRIRHAAEDARVSAVFEAIAHDVALMHARPHKDYGLNRKKRRETDVDQLALVRVLDLVGKVIGVSVPDLYLQPEEPGELLVANTCDRRCHTPSLVARGDALRGRRGGELAYIAGHSLTLLRDEYLIKLALPAGAELRTVYQAALALAGAGSVVPEAEAAVEAMRVRLDDALAPHAHQRLADAVASAGSGVCTLDPIAWSNAAELTAQRVGFVLAGDVGTAARAITRDATLNRGTALAAKIEQLLRYAISEEYFAVRAELGTTIARVAAHAPSAG